MREDTVTTCMQTRRKSAAADRDCQHCAALLVSGISDIAFLKT